MVREFAEELLGASEDHDADEAPTDYDAWPFAKRMSHARHEGSVRVFCLGMGVDPLTFATDLLTAVVIDAPVFDDLFGELVDINAEGQVLSSVTQSSAPSHGIAFAATTIDQLVEEEPMQAAGAATLALAWRHRQTLLG
jgi:hypothetical protein